MESRRRIKLYICDIKNVSHIDMSVTETFPEYRRKRILAAGSERVRASNYAAGLLLRDILGVTEDKDICFSEKGKPYLKTDGQFFSLSHDDLHVVLATGDCEVGIDAEVLRTLKGSVRNRVFTEEERSYCGDDIKKGIWLWTRLEAALKLSGEGIGGIDKRTFSLLEENDGLYIETFEEGGSLISIASGCPFDTERVNYIPV